ncbi:1-phosphofructokinase family hexose kinase [Pontibacter oryzae]|uniref:1-phosphofructokinase family hexose kinase n=1 Tax=Pontibacter oryzae TaxID=2304593 RepID=A0A399SIE2_9BACT|nr:hexose kinase [Pontibacter oryzae]RIJ41892.1 1-phosphofructokinase family hexose kinase [Pontibacter oryzae]
MHDIITITLNPALDKSTHVAQVLPEKKLRCNEPTYESGGGGVNVSRALKKLGGSSCAWVWVGGPSGKRLCALLQSEGVDVWAVETKNWTRENLMVMEDNSGNQYRFGMPGPYTYEDEWERCLKQLTQMPDEELPKFVVASGSLPPGVPEDFYSQLAGIAKARGFKLLVDTSGDALLKAAGEGVYLLKPNIGELAALAGKEKISAMEQEEIAMQVINAGKCKVLVVSLGARGAMLASKDGISYVVPPIVPQQSAVGAGDSMVAGMVLGLLNGNSLGDVARYGVAAGTAATMTPGSELCRQEDTDKIFRWLQEHKVQQV